MIKLLSLILFIVSSLCSTLTKTLPTGETQRTWRMNRVPSEHQPQLTALHNAIKQPSAAVHTALSELGVRPTSMANCRKVLVGRMRREGPQVHPSE
ncbi:hypothetical protein EDB80DRAFT_725028 [Ilyonectria destructans]|nr:hypothetical protein EDB80DRAFT_725028 [Ilyonectria destructans]